MKNVRWRRGLRLCGALLALPMGACAHFAPLQGELSPSDVDGQWIKTPYLATHAYYGVMQPAPPTQWAQNEAQLPFVHVVLVTPVSELGFEVASPSRRHPLPSHHDVVEPDWPAHAREGAYFDACVQVEQCLTDDALTDPQGCRRWRLMGHNEDSPEVAPDPHGEARNALLRLAPSASAGDGEPDEALRPGLYRVQVAGCHRPPTAGTFVLRIGAPIAGAIVHMGRSQRAALLALDAATANSQAAPAPIKTHSFVPPLPDSLAPPHSSMQKGP